MRRWLLLVALLMCGLWTPVGACRPHTYTVDVTASPYNAVCNGVANDAVALQAAIASVPTVGGTVVLPSSGLCGVGAAGLVLTDRSRVTLRGAGPGAGLQALAVGPLFHTFGGTMLRLITCDRCEVRGLVFDGGGLAVNLIGVGTSTGAVVTGNTLRNAGGTGAVVAHANTGNYYGGNTITALLNVSRGLWLGDSNVGEEEIRPVVTSNQITLNTHTAIAIVATGAEIRANMLTHLGGSDGSGIALAGVTGTVFHDGLITGNTITGFPFHGVQSDAQTDSDWTYNVTVTDNIIRGCTNYGLYVNRARTWTMARNTVENNLLGGIAVSMARDVVAEDNTIRDTRVGGARTQTIGIRVSGQTSALEVQRVILRDNTLDNQVYYGVYMVNASPATMNDILVENNVITNNTEFGIFVADVADGDITNVVLSGNTLSGNGDTIRCDPSDCVIE